jgi:hypothetical protein
MEPKNVVFAIKLFILGVKVKSYFAEIANLVDKLFHKTLFDAKNVKMFFLVYILKMFVKNKNIFYFNLEIV